MRSRRHLLAVLAVAGSCSGLASEASADFNARDSRKITITSLGFSRTANVTGQTGRVKNVRVTLNGVTHKDADDLDVVLVSPGGKSTLLVSDACDGDVNGLNWTLDMDAAGGLAAAAASCNSGTFRPTNFEPAPDVFPGGPTVISSPADLNNFTGSDPNGLWKLFVASDEEGALGEGTIEKGWSLSIETVEGDAVVPGAPSGAASVYPLGRTIEGLSGVITDVDVTLPSVVHQLASDLDMVLVSPRGTAVRLLAGSCSGAAVRGAQWTFDDEAATPAPKTGCAVDGRYRPTNGLTTNRPLPAPGPAAAGIESSLSAFDGTDPNGEWKLFVNDTNPTTYDGTLKRPVITLTVRPAATVSLADQAQTVAEGETRTLTLTRSGDPAQLGPASVKVSTVTGTATEGDDYAPVSAVVEFARGQATRTIDVQVLADAAFEPLETFAVELSSPVDDAALGTAVRTTVTIPAQDPPAQGGGGQQPTGGGDPGPGGGVGGPVGGGSGGGAVGGGAVGGGAGADRLAPSLRVLRVARSRATFRLSEFANVRMIVERIRPGRKARRVGSARTVKAGPGRNTVRLRRLKPGRYRLTAVATDTAGNAGKAVRASFSIKRKRSRP